MFRILQQSSNYCKTFSHYLKLITNLMPYKTTTMVTSTMPWRTFEHFWFIFVIWWCLIYALQGKAQPCTYNLRTIFSVTIYWCRSSKAASLINRQFLQCVQHQETQHRLQPARLELSNTSSCDGRLDSLWLAWLFSRIQFYAYAAAAKWRKKRWKIFLGLVWIAKNGAR